MRTSEGLLMDKVVVVDTNQDRGLVPAPFVDTSPSNIAFDLLIQIEALQFSELRETAKEAISKNLVALSRMTFHQSSGLFLNRYRVDETLSPTEFFVSAVDNTHLYLALWSLNQLPHSFDGSKELLNRMNLSVFYDANKDLVFGGLKCVDGCWELVPWRYGYLGSEGRVIYTLAAAFDLFPIDKIFNHLEAEIFVDPEIGEVLGLWDGGTFQLLLPELLLKESCFSQKLKELFNNYIEYLKKERIRRGLDILPTHSACQTSLVPDIYNGKLGSLHLVSSLNALAHHSRYRDEWEHVVSPYATFLAATIDPNEIIPMIKKMENKSDGSRRLYHPQWGWLDGIHIQGSRAGEIVPMILALDQTIIGLSVARIMSPKGCLTFTQQLRESKKKEKKINKFYKEMDMFLNTKATRFMMSS